MENETDRWTTSDTWEVIEGLAVLLAITAIALAPIVIALMYGRPEDIRLPWATSSHVIQSIPR